MRTIPVKSFSSYAGAVLALTLAFAVTGCGTLIDMGRNDQVDPRRIYLNDAAANDSLPGTLTTEGLLLVMQPQGKQYKLVTTNGNASDQLDFYVRNSSGGFAFQGTYSGAPSGGGLVYTLSAPTTKTAADYYLVFLRSAGNLPVTEPTSVKFSPIDTAQANSVTVRLHMVRQLEGLNTDAQKGQYANAFHTELRSIFAAYGITVDTSTVIVEPTEDPLTVTYNGESFTLPGTRHPNAINLYLVNSIDGGDVGSIVVGFAPREAFDLSTDENSRVLLNVQGSLGTINQKAASMAVTAAHEMGHFLGMRHTSATLGDREYDDDESNRDDGFASTSFCAILEKKSAEPSREIIRKGPGGHVYCLRVMGTSVTCSCPDVGNLMYPYKCNTTQKTLGADQQKVVRNNLKIFKPL